MMSGETAEHGLVDAHDPPAGARIVTTKMHAGGGSGQSLSLSDFVLWKSLLRLI
jgi:hypothetical protein